MSIAVLTEVYDEMRRLAIAGSVTAAGDFRLKKLVPSLEQAGQKAPVFGKVAEAVKAVVNANEKTSAEALLELTTLVNAILYTQGDTGLTGEIKPIETTDLGAPTAQASSRVIKPLLEALASTGSGRLELIRDACERGAFRDLRLVKPALEAIDDGYGEIGDLIAEKVLPLYGKAIVPELRARFDPKGRGGHPRRLKLMHQLDPAGTRELVKQTLDNGSKETKVVAIECLGGEKEDLSYLLEQASAKAQDVRQAAYRALAALEDEAAVTVLQKAAGGKDLDIAGDALVQAKSGKVLDFLISEAEKEVAALPKVKDKKDVSDKINRIHSLLNCLAQRQDKKSEAFILKVFEQREELAKIKGATSSGSDLNQAVVGLMAGGTKKMQETLAARHDKMSPDELEPCFEAARAALSAAELFKRFSPYLMAKVDEKKKDRDPAYARRGAILSALDADTYYGLDPDKDARPLDSRWFDIAVEIKHLGLIRQLARPGHAGAREFLSERFKEALKKSKDLDDCHEVVWAMSATSHPDATDAFIAVCEKHAKKSHYYSYWFARLITELPKSAIPKLEALLPKLNDKVADSLLDYIQQLREQK
jgi:hypothetical protein